MKYTVKMSCGHEVTVELFGKSADRERKIAYYEAHGLCDECAAKMRAERNAQNAMQDSQDGLPVLTGSDKQIAWAHTIRQDLLKKVADAMANVPADDARIAPFVAWVKGQSASRFWIDHRYASVQTLVKDWRVSVNA